LRYLVRPMCIGDVPQVTDIDRECFPTQWPTLSFRRELVSNRLSHYLVILENGTRVAEPEDMSNDTGSASGNRFPERLRRFFFADRSSEPATQERILGMVGFWTMAGEAHISTIGIRPAYRRQGLGELLLISAIELAQVLDSTIVTLEVRASNLPAQTLYEKYGFTRVGVRKGYYSDREDALIMTTDTIGSGTFQGNFQRLRQVHVETWGPTPCQLT
jgi:ribosomal-protein-alanine N-acetyltransferase